MDSPNTQYINAKNIEQYQLLYCEALSDRDWDYYSINNYPELYKNIGFAMFGPPEQKHCTTVSVCTNKNQSEPDEYDDIVYTDKQKQQIDPVYNAIIKYGAFDLHPGNIYMSVIFVFGEKLNVKDGSGIFQVPVFRIRKCRPKIDEFEYYESLHSITSYGFTYNEINLGKNTHYCHIFIDDEARVYNNWEHYLKKNKLPKCRMHVPRNGIYQCRILNKEQELVEVMLDRFLSPACSILKRIANTADVVGTVGSVGSVAVVTAAAVPSIVMAPAVLTGAAIIGIGTGLYSAGRSVYGLVDRGQHKQSVGLKNAESRNHYLNVAGGVIAGSAAGAGKLVGMTVEKGVTIGTAGRAALNIVTGANAIINGAGVINSLYVFKIKLDRNEELSKFDMLKLSSTILFFSHTAWKANVTNITEEQIQLLSVFESNLITNRKKKLFQRTLKEADSDNNVGKIEIIRGLRVIPSDNNLVNIISCDNHLNDDNVRFKMGVNGKVELNNSIFIESSEFTNLPTTLKLSTFSGNIPQANNFTEISTKLASLLTSRDVEEKFRCVLNNFEVNVQNIIKKILVTVYEQVQDLIKSIERLYPKTAPILALLQFIFELILQECMLKVDFCSLTFDITTITFITQIFVLIYENRAYLMNIVQSFRQWIEPKVIKFWENYQQTKTHIINKSIEHKCQICSGIYYTYQ